MERKKSLLERRSLTAQTGATYDRLIRNYAAFCAENGFPEAPGPRTDVILLDLFDKWFLEGYGPNVGEKMEAALCFREPRLKEMMEWSLVRSRRALKGWRRAAPAGSRLPFPVLLVCGLVEGLMAGGNWLMGIYLLLAFVCYLRPHEGLDLKVRDIIPPVRGAGASMDAYVIIVRNSLDGIPDKVGVFDNSLRLDQLIAPSLGRVLHDLCRGRKEEEKLFPFSLSQCTGELNSMARKLGINGQVSVYQCQDGGAAHDLCNKLRPRGEVQARGRWVAEASLKRYTKVGKTQSMLVNLGRPVLNYLRASERRIDALVARGVRATLPPQA